MSVKRYRAPVTSTGSLVCYIVGTVLICAYGVGIVLIIIGILLPHAHKFFCGGLSLSLSMSVESGQPQMM